MNTASTLFTRVRRNTVFAHDGPRSEQASREWRRASETKRLTPPSVVQATQLATRQSITELCYARRFVLAANSLDKLVRFSRNYPDMKTSIPTVLITFALVCFALVQNTQAVNPPPDGGYPGGNTAEGINALDDVNTAVGINNTAVGANALTHDTTGYYNVAVGSGALASNTTGNFNMAIGAGALLNNNANFNLAIGYRVLFRNTIGNHLTGIGAAALLNNTTAAFNTAIGADALEENTIGEDNTAIGADALAQNTTGHGNTAIGEDTLYSNTTGRDNTAIGIGSLFSNTTGNGNTAIGVFALLNNITGHDNTANGFGALGQNTIGTGNTANGSGALPSNTTGSNNTANGDNALGNNTIGNNNVALGNGAGSSATTGSSNVYVGAGMQGVAGENNACYIASIFGQTSANGIPILINPNNKLGTATSSKRFKEDIESMDKASEALFSLKPVTFRYRKEIDPQGTSQLGLVAEDVEKVNPNLVVRDKEGKPYSVRYDQVNAMLLNEFLKEHSTVQELKKEIATLIATVKEQAAQIQKVSAQLEASKAAPRVVANDQ